MEKRKALLLVVSAALLAGCASAPPSAHEVSKLHNEVSKLNQEMGQLTRQAGALEQQNNLNSHSNQGAWLVPTARTAVVLQSQLGDLRLSLSNIEPDGNGSQALLHIRAASGELPAGFSAQVEWGERDLVSGRPMPAGSQVQTIHVAAALVPRTEATVALRLSNLPPEQLGYLRVHDVVPDPQQ